MEIIKNKNASQLTVSLIGRLDTTSAPQLEEELFSSLEGVEELVFDLSELPYTSSAGLRVFLKAQKQMNAQGKMRIIGADEDIKEIFEITGLNSVIDIE